MVTSEQWRAWEERARLAEQENERLSAVVEDMRAKGPQGMSRLQAEPTRDLTPAEMLRLAADMIEARQVAQAKPIVDHLCASLAMWAESQAAPSESPDAAGQRQGKDNE